MNGHSFGTPQDPLLDLHLAIIESETSFVGFLALRLDGKLHQCHP